MPFCFLLFIIMSTKFQTFNKTILISFSTVVASFLFYKISLIPPRQKAFLDWDDEDIEEIRKIEKISIFTEEDWYAFSPKRYISCSLFLSNDIFFKIKILFVSFLNVILLVMRSQQQQPLFFFLFSLFKKLWNPEFVPNNLIQKAFKKPGHNNKKINGIHETRMFSKKVQVKMGKKWNEMKFVQKNYFIRDNRLIMLK